METKARSVRLAAIQAGPVFLDRDATVEKACRLIREAGAAGANIIGFPEGFIPAHPLWYHFHPASSRAAYQFSQRLFLNAIIVPGPETERLCMAAAEAGVFVVMGVCEREHERIGTMYNSLLFIDESGRIVGKHRKLVPTLGERLVHAPGDARGMKPYETPYGKVSGLLCAENSNPLATYALDALGANVHVASWPAHFPVGVDMSDIILFTSRSLAYRMKAFVINAVGELSDEMRQQLPANDEQRAFLATQGGGASIIGPRGEILAGPMPAGEGILYADVSLDQLVVPKIVQDFGGHYNRFDVFEVNLSPGEWRNLHHRDTSPSDGDPFPPMRPTSAGDF